jgi:hypothetical protein
LSRLRSSVWCTCLLLPLLLAGYAGAESEQAARLRGQNGLVAFVPPEAFLRGNFLADETDPAFIFGKVRDFATSLACPTAWLIEAAELKRVESRGAHSGPVEYSIYLEADCGGKVAYYIFVDRSLNPAQWLEWRRQFHKNKADPHYKDAKTSLDQAAQSGFSVDAELRFVALDGDLLMKRPEDVLASELKFRPIYDLKKNQPLAK